MHKKIRSRLSSVVAGLGDQPGSASQEKRKYVLEDVFWVPVDNCSSQRSASSREPQPPSRKLDTSEAAGFSDMAMNTTRKRIRDRYLF